MRTGTVWCMRGATKRPGRPNNKQSHAKARPTAATCRSSRDRLSQVVQVGGGELLLPGLLLAIRTVTLKK